MVFFYCRVVLGDWPKYFSMTPSLTMVSNFPNVKDPVPECLGNKLKEVFTRKVIRFRTLSFFYLASSSTDSHRNHTLSRFRSEMNFDLKCLALCWTLTRIASNSFFIFLKKSHFVKFLISCTDEFFCDCWIQGRIFYVIECCFSTGIMLASSSTMFFSAKKLRYLIFTLEVRKNYHLQIWTNYQLSVDDNFVEHTERKKNS